MVAFPGVTQHDITVTAGRTHFFLAKLSERAQTLNVTSAAGELTGLVVGTLITSGDSNPGPIDFIPLEEGAADRRLPSFGWRSDGRFSSSLSDLSITDR